MLLSWIFDFLGINKEKEKMPLKQQPFPLLAIGDVSTVNNHASEHIVIKNTNQRAKIPIGAGKRWYLGFDKTGADAIVSGADLFNEQTKFIPNFFSSFDLYVKGDDAFAVSRQLSNPIMYFRKGLNDQTLDVHHIPTAMHNNPHVFNQNHRNIEIPANFQRIDNYSCFVFQIESNVEVTIVLNRNFERSSMVAL